MGTKIPRKNAGLLPKFNDDEFNASIRSSKFHNKLKQPYIVPEHKIIANYLKNHSIVFKSYRINLTI